MANQIDINRLSIVNEDDNAPKVKSFTPPPPGFTTAAAANPPPSCSPHDDGNNNDNNDNNGASSSGRPQTKSPSYQNLALALGTGLAECMDDSTSDNKRAAVVVTNNNNNSGLDSMDNYARQSRHAVTRLMGHPLVQQHQQEGRGSVPPTLNGSGNHLMNPNNNSGGAAQQQQVRFTAAMMVQQSNSGHITPSSGGQQHQQQQQQANSQFLNANDLLLHHRQQQQQQQQLLSNSTNGGGGGANNNSLNGYNPLSKQQSLSLQQQSLQQQQQSLQQQQQWGHHHHHHQGVTVVEPNSARNSPAIIHNKDGTTTIGGSTLMGGFPILSTTGGAGGVPATGAVATGGIVGGRASAPPSNLIHHGSSSGGAGGGVGGVGTVLHQSMHPNLRAYTASSLQMRVAELHQELGGGGGGGGRSTTPVGVVGGPTSSSRPTTPGQPPQQQRGPTPTTTQPQQQQQQPLRTIIVTSATPPLHPSSTPRPMVIANTPPLQQQQAVVVTATAAAGRRSEQREREQIAAQELAPFLKRDVTISNNNKSESTTNSSGSSTEAASNSKNSSGSTSRGLAILYASSLNIPEVRSTCEAFGALESFRSDFAETRGVFFATFHDLRSAQMAVGELPNALNKMLNALVGGGGGGGMRTVEVAYCVPLNASNATDESMLLLSNLPGSVDEQDLSRMLSSFGEVRAIHYQANMAADAGDDDDDLASYMVEFFDSQDARQALMELEQTNPWGGKARVKIATRSPTKRKQGKELIMLMSNWRQGVSPKQQHGGGEGAVSSSSSVTRSPSPPAVTKQSPPQPGSNQTADTTFSGHVHHNMQGGAAAAQPYYQYSHQGDIQQQYAAQLVLGPDGHYQYMLVNHPGHYVHPGQMVIDPHQQQLMYASADQQYMHNPHMNPQQYHHIQYANPMPGTSYAMLSHDIQQQQQPPTQFVRMPSDAVSGGEVNSSSLSSGSQSPGASRSRASARALSGKSNGSIGSGSSGNNSGGNSEETNDLSLFIENVKSGKDVRSSLMVRNIPNKYTQQMLLGEFAAAGHGPDKMDFFYLPIDFKNKCNRGYAFVNFVDYKDIVPFVDRYNGTGWKSFNSEKICDITYARIQGKAAMLKRFENSALMAKDDEYRPMVFVSHGERKGQRESFG